MKPHTVSTYEEELQALSVRVIHMGVLACKMLRDGTRALLSHDAELARSVIRDDDRLDALEMEADRRALDLLALRAPLGTDLRFIMAVMKAVTDLERAGDLATNLARRSLDLISAPGISPPAEVQALAEASTHLLETAVLAWRTQDVSLAHRIKQDDAEVDRLNNAAYARLTAITRDHPDQFERALALSSICRYFERVGDHAVNLSERVIYWVEGTETRHGGS